MRAAVALLSLLVGCDVTSLAAPADATAAPATVTVTPAEDESAVLHNPDMGWVLYENYPLDPPPGGSSTMVGLPGEDFEGVGHVAVMFSWFDTEKSPGEYDFSLVDHAYDHWRSRGKQIQLRLSTETLLWWDNADPPRGKGPPDYVVEKLPAERKQVRRVEGLPPYAVVDARDPYYRQRLEAFLAAVAAHYSEEAGRPVTLVDLRGFGVWGEWHSGFQYASVEERREALIGVIDLYAAAFKDNFVSLSYSYDPDGPKELYAGPTDKYDEGSTAHYQDFLRFSAFDHALTVPNLTFRRDGVGGAVHSNERKLCEEAFATPGRGAAFRGPMMCEFMDGYAASKRGGEGWVEWKVDDALSLHPNYINLLGWAGGDALAFLRERQDLIEHGLRNMGYRLVPTKVTYPQAVVAGEPFKVAFDWVNRGVGRAACDYEVGLLLSDNQGEVVARSSGGTLPTSQWVKGQDYTAEVEVKFDGAVADGSYELRLVLTDPRTDRPIALPLKDAAAADGSYAVGSIQINVSERSTREGAGDTDEGNSSR